MRVLLTGASGFLGWHTRVRFRAMTDHVVVPVTRQNWLDLPALVREADAVVHVAGVNRGQPTEVEKENVRLAEDVAEAVRAAHKRTDVVYANSIQAGRDTAYGVGKQRAAETLQAVTQGVGGRFADIRLPNLFGEHGLPRYNSFVSTFVSCVVHRREPQIQDREVKLLHAQDAAQALIDGLGRNGQMHPAGTSATVRGVYDTLARFCETYSAADVPPLASKYEVDLFNTYRAALFPEHYPFPLQTHTDERGRLVETVRAHGGQGQTFLSSTGPGRTRGEHFHLSKVERFVVLGGRARISLRRLYHEEVVSFDVAGEEPAVIDMPTMWTHNITNTGDQELTTLFWTNSLFDPEAPDTHRQSVPTLGKDGA